MKDDVHVHPVRDLREHDLTSRTCWCRPTVTLLASRPGRALVVHQSADGRELVEQHGLQ